MESIRDRDRGALHDLYDYLVSNYTDRENFREFCRSMTDIKQNGTSFLELVTAVTESFQPEHATENEIVLMLPQKSYKISNNIHNYLKRCWGRYDYCCKWQPLIREFLEKKDTGEDFYSFLAEDFSATLTRYLYKYDLPFKYAFPLFKNIKNNQNIKKFCRIVDNLGENEPDIFEIFDLYRTVYGNIWRVGRYYGRELLIYDAVLSFLQKYSANQRKQVKFYDFLLVKVLEHYLQKNNKRLDIAEKVKSKEILPCPFCGKPPQIYAAVQWYGTVEVTIACEDCFHSMNRDLIRCSGFRQSGQIHISSLEEAANDLIDRWNRRIKNDDMWLDDESLPDELPECEPGLSAKDVYAPGLKPCPFCGSKAALRKQNSERKRDGKRDPERIKTIKVVCSKGCFSASHFGTPESVPDKHTIGYMAYRWNQRKGLI